MALMTSPLGLWRSSRPVFMRSRCGQDRSPLARVRFLVRAQSETSPDREPKEPPLPEWMLRELRSYDETIEKAREACLKQRQEVEE